LVTDNPLEPPPWINAPPVEPSPFEETHDLRVGPDLHPALLGLLPYIGVWRGRGIGGYPTIEDFHYAQEIRISHDGRPFLAYESHSWVIEEDGTPIRPGAREVGWIRPVIVDDVASDEVEALFTAPTGVMELHLGKVDGLKLELVSDAVVRTSTAKSVSAGHRLYGIVEGALLYAQEMAAMGLPLTSHLSARLLRVAG
jgi:THAP4-like, heme-binding beta-barrel domain